jgi:hypothetical protein
MRPVWSLTADALCCTNAIDAVSQQYRSEYVAPYGNRNYRLVGTGRNWQLAYLLALFQTG